MSSADLNNLFEYVKSLSAQILNKSASSTWYVSKEHIAPTLRNLLQSHPDFTSLLLLLITLYVSIMVLTTASRWMYSAVMTMVKLVFTMALILGAVWVVKVGQGENATETVTSGIQWTMNQGKRYVWNAAGEILNR